MEKFFVEIDVQIQDRKNSENIRLHSFWKSAQENKNKKQRQLNFWIHTHLDTKKILLNHKRRKETVVNSFTLNNERKTWFNK